MTSPAGVAVVMITMDRPHRVAETVGRLRALPEQPTVVVVDHGRRPLVADDGLLADGVLADPGVTVLRPGRNLGAAGRNLGVAACTEPVVAFADDDSWWAPGALARAARLLDDHPRLGLVAGRVVVEPHGRTDPFCDVLADSPIAGSGPGTPILGFMACAAVVRRSAFLEAGGFPAGVGVGGEEARLALDLASAGWDLRYVPDVVAHHEPTPSASRHGRDRREVRNALWTAWQRLPIALAVRASRDALRRVHPRDGAAGLLDAVRGLGRVVRDRRPVPPHVADQRAQLLR